MLHPLRWRRPVRREFSAAAAAERRAQNLAGEFEPSVGEDDGLHAVLVLKGRRGRSCSAAPPRRLTG